MKKELLIALSLLIMIGFLPVNIVHAQSEATSSVETAEENSSEEVSLEEALLDEEGDSVQEENIDELEGLEVKEITKAPGNFGLWLRGIREKVSLTFTVDPVKKAEKQLRFAEERMLIAERIVAETNDPKAQKRMERVIDQAQRFIDNVEEKKEKWEAKDNNRSRRLLKNIATHQVRKERVLNRIEESISEEGKDRFAKRREIINKNSERILNAINNDNLPEEVKTYLKKIKERVELRTEEIRNFNEKRQTLQEAVESGDPEARGKLAELRSERKNKLREVREEYKASLDRRQKQNGMRSKARDRVKDLKERAESGDEEAENRLEKLKERGEKMRKNRIESRPEMSDKKVKTKQRVKTTLKDIKIRQEIRERVKDRGEKRRVRNEKEDRVVPKKIVPQDIKKREAKIRERVLEKRKREKVRENNKEENSDEKVTVDATNKEGRKIRIKAKW